MRLVSGRGRFFTCAAVLGALFAMSPEALATVKRAGSWPESEKKVTLDVSRVTRDEAIRKLAEAAGWSVVVHAPQADRVDMHVKDQPADKVLELLLMDADYVATRDGSLVSIRRVSGDAPGKDPAAPDEGPMPAIPPIPAIPAIPDIPIPGVPAIPAIPAVPPVGPVPPEAPDAPEPPEAPEAPDEPDEPEERSRDREVMGQSLKIAKGEVVDDVHVMGGSLDVYGTVKGDIDVAGGAVRIHEGARVRGDITAVGGSIKIDDGARVDGEVVAKGGSVKRGEKAIIGGDVRGLNRSARGHGKLKDKHKHSHEPAPGDDGATAQGPEQVVQSKAAEVGSALARMALLFVFGTVLLALVPERMDNLKAELVARPMRSFAMGVLGVLGAAAGFLVLCVTVIGIPFALLGALAAALALATSLCAVLETVGRALVRHKSQNPYLHLAVGCFLFLAFSAIPVVGPIVTVSTCLFATGILVSTRLAGLVQKKNGGAPPYRAAPAM